MLKIHVLLFLSDESVVIRSKLRSDITKHVKTCITSIIISVLLLTPLNRRIQMVNQKILPNRCKDNINYQHYMAYQLY